MRHKLWQLYPWTMLCIMLTKTTIVFLLLFSLPLCASAEFYKWVDESGVVHYTDKRPDDGAVPLDLPKSMFFNPGNRTSSSSSAGKQQDTATEDLGSYQKLAISKPANGETVRSNEGNVTVIVELEPNLGKTHLLQLFLDGEAVGGGLKTSSMMLQNVERGTHRLQANVINAEGGVIATSNTVTFELKREGIPTEAPENPDDAFKPDYTPANPDKAYTPASSKDTYKPSAPSGYPSTPGGSAFKPTVPAKPFKPSYTPSYKQ